MTDKKKEFSFEIGFYRTIKADTFKEAEEKAKRMSFRGSRGRFIVRKK